VSKIGDVFGPEGWIGSLWSDDSSPGGCIFGLLLFLAIIGAIIWGFVWLLVNFPPLAVVIMIWPEIVLTLFLLRRWSKRDWATLWKNPNGFGKSDYSFVIWLPIFFITVLISHLAGIGLSLSKGWTLGHTQLFATSLISFGFSIGGIILSIIPGGLIATLINWVYEQISD